MAGKVPAQRVVQVNTDVYIFPHSIKEGFSRTKDLREWLLGELKNEREGLYHVVSESHYRGPQRGDLVLFHKDRQFVGEARVARAVRRYPQKKRYKRIGKEYEGEIIFDPKSIKTYRHQVAFDAIRRTTPFSTRGPSQVSWRDYYKIRPAA